MLTLGEAAQVGMYALLAEAEVYTCLKQSLVILKEANKLEVCSFSIIYLYNL